MPRPCPLATTGRASASAQRRAASLARSAQTSDPSTSTGRSASRAAGQPGQRIRVGLARGRWVGVGQPGGGLGEQRLQGEVEEHRAAVGLGGQPQGPVDPGGDVGDVADGAGVLGHGRDQWWMVELLEAPGPPAPARGPAPKDQHRRPVEVGGGDRAHPVGHPGPGGQHRHPGSPQQLGRRLGCEHRRLLVPDVDQPHRRVRLHRPVIQRKDMPPDSVNSSSTPCRRAAATASAPPCPSRIVPPTITPPCRQPPDATGTRGRNEFPSSPSTRGPAARGSRGPRPFTRTCRLGTTGRLWHPAARDPTHPKYPDAARRATVVGRARAAGGPTGCGRRTHRGRCGRRPHRDPGGDRPEPPGRRPEPPAAAVPHAGALQCAGAEFGPPVGERTGPNCGVPVVVHRGVTERGRPPEAVIVWRRSRALGRPDRGRLAGGVELPATGTHFVTVDPVTGTSPNRAWRRHGTDRLVEVLLRVAGEHAAAHPDAPRLVVGDLSRPRGGKFGKEYGGDGHRSHQNGLDADVYYPRRDGQERIRPGSPRSTGGWPRSWWTGSCEPGRSTCSSDPAPACTAPRRWS